MQALDVYIHTMKITIPELEDLPWFPSKLRQMQMEFIGFMVVFLKVYEPVKPVIIKCLAQSKTHMILDLCSGSGEPIRSLAIDKPNLEQVVLSDLYPAPKQEDGICKWHLKSLNALEPHAELPGMRTMFNAFHHFNEDEKNQILEAHSNQGIFIAEILSPNLLNLIKIIFTTIIGQLVFTPFVKPFSFQRLIFTYLIPINLFTVTWDGVVSVLKSQNDEMMHKAVLNHFKNTYTISHGQCGPFWARVSWMFLIKI